MRLRAIFVAGCMLSAFASAPVSAAPQATQMTITQPDTGVALAQIRDKSRGIRLDSGNPYPNRYRGNRGYRGDRGFRSDRGFRRDRGYRSGPRGWNRYSSRPYNYRSRGCIVIGPVWYCP